MFRYAVATDRAERTPATDIRGALPPAKQSHDAAITGPKDIGAPAASDGRAAGRASSPNAPCAGALTFARPDELRKAEWSKIDLEQAEWCVPAERMKGAGGSHRPPVDPAASVGGGTGTLAGTARRLVRAGNRKRAKQTIGRVGGERLDTGTPGAAVGSDPGSLPAAAKRARGLPMEAQ